MTSTIKKTDWTCEFRPLAWDSEHFGFSIGQLSPLRGPGGAIVTHEAIQQGIVLIKKVCDEAFQHGAKLICANADCEDSAVQRALCSSGFVLMDSLVTHRLELNKVRGDLQKSPNMRLAREADLPSLERISEECFGDRTYNVNRFNSDPAIDQARVRELYRLWMKNSLHPGKLADELHVYEQDGEVLGFVTLKVPAGEDASIPLNAVAVRAHGKGIYTKMVHHVVRSVMDRRFKVIEIKTQLPNVSVHKAWARIGAALVHTEHRFHRSAPIE